jgi:hypothetical protein
MEVHRYKIPVLVAFVNTVKHVFWVSAVMLNIKEVGVEVPLTLNHINHLGKGV